MERTSLFGPTIKKVSEILKIDQLYPVDQKDADKLTDLLTQCFAEDPLYCQLIPQKTMRKRLLPGLFQCDLDELFQTCHVYADSPEMNGIIIVSDETEPQNGVRRRIVEMFASWKTAALLLEEDPSCKTLWNFIRGQSTSTPSGPKIWAKRPGCMWCTLQCGPPNGGRVWRAG